MSYSTWRKFCDQSFPFLRLVPAVNNSPLMGCFDITCERPDRSFRECGRLPMRGPTHTGTRDRVEIQRCYMKHILRCFERVEPPWRREPR